MNLLALAVLALGAWAAPSRPPDRGPYVVAVSSVSARMCWRLAGAEGCRTFADLPAGLPFSYAVPGSTAAWTARLLPKPGETLRFAAFGDTGKASPAQYRVARLVEERDPHLILHLGDVIYPTGKDSDYDAKYFAPYARIISRIAVYPAVGNHDYGNSWLKGRGRRRFEEAYARIFRKPPYYSLRAGPVHFISLDTNQAYRIPAAAPIAAGTEQWRWAEKELLESRAPWRIVLVHVPLYSTFGHADQKLLRRELQPLFERRKVDLVLQGHAHFYERSRLMGGVLYMTAGTGGANLHPGKPRAEWLEKKVRSHGFVAATVDERTLTLEFVDDAARVLDRVELKK